MSAPQSVIQANQTRGVDAQTSSFSAISVVTEVLKTSFGSMGMDKMLIDSLGDAVITNDGATILKELDIQHPAARILIDASMATDKMVGDGTTSTALLAGALLAECEKLIAKDIHPNIIFKALRKVSAELTNQLEKLAIDVDLKNKKLIDNILSTTLASKVISSDTDIINNLVVTAIDAIRNGDEIDLSTIKVEKQLGGSIRDSTIIGGVVLDKTITNSGMPRKLLDAKIALINDVLEIKRPENDQQINVAPGQVFDISVEEHKKLKEIANKIIDTGANVVFCQRGIDDTVLHFLEKAGIITLRRIKEHDMINLSKCTEAKIVSTIHDFSSADLGLAGVVREETNSKLLFVEECKNTKSVTILLRGANQQIIDEMERSLHDAIMVLKDVITAPKIVVGAGAPEITLSKGILKWGTTSLKGRDMLVAEAMSKALLELPLTLAKNVGMDPIDTELAIKTTTEDGIGINIIDNTVSKPVDVYEPLVVKSQVITGAIETACIILRIDNMFASTRETTKPGFG